MSCGLVDMAEANGGYLWVLRIIACNRWRVHSRGANRNRCCGFLVHQRCPSAAGGTSVSRPCGEARGTAKKGRRAVPITALRGVTGDRHTGRAASAVQHSSLSVATRHTCRLPVDLGTRRDDTVSPTSPKTAAERRLSVETKCMATKCGRQSVGRHSCLPSTSQTGMLRTLYGTATGKIYGHREVERRVSLRSTSRTRRRWRSCRLHRFCRRGASSGRRRRCRGRA